MRVRCRRSTAALLVRGQVPTAFSFHRAKLMTTARRRRHDDDLPPLPNACGCCAVMARSSLIGA